MKEFLTPEYIAIIVISVLIITAIFFAFVANKVAGVDHKITDLTDDIHKKVEKNINSLAVQMHDDFKQRGDEQETKLNQMGDTWRSSLEKTVTEVKGEVGKLKGEVTHNADNLREEVLKIMTENAVNFNEQIAQVRDTNVQEIQKYQKSLSQQVREYAHKEHESLNKVLNDLSGNVKGNLNDLVENQKSAIKNITTTVGSGYTALAQKVETDINKSTDTATDTLATITKNINTSINEVNTKVNKDLNEIGDQLTANLTEVNSKVDSSLNNVSKNLTKNIGTLSKRLNEDIDVVSGKLDKSVADVSDNLNKSVGAVSENLNSSLNTVSKNLNESVSNVAHSLETNVDNVTQHLNKSVSNVEEKIDAGLDQVSKKFADNLLTINKNVDKGMNSINVAVDDNFDKVGEKVNTQIKKDMESLIGVFKTFASKVEAIDKTRSHILELADNVNVLSQVLDDRRSRGNIGEVLIESVVSDNLSPTDYELNHELSNGFQVDCLLKLPKPSGNIAINTKVDISDLEVINSPSESKEKRAAARKSFYNKLSKAISDTSKNCIINNETAEAAILLMPSESAFSEAHVHHRALVDQSYRQQVWLASPSTLIAMVTVARGVIKDATARNEIEVLNKELIDIDKDYRKLEKNIKGLTNNIDELLSTSTETRITARKIGDRFDQLQSIIRKNPDYNKVGVTPAIATNGNAAVEEKPKVAEVVVEAPKVETKPPVSPAPAPKPKEAPPVAKVATAPTPPVKQVSVAKPAKPAAVHKPKAPAPKTHR